VGSVAKDLHWLHEIIAEQKGISLVDQEIMPDHVHLFVNTHPIFAPAKIVKIFKGITAKKLFEKHPELRKQLWNGHLWNP